MDLDVTKPKFFQFNVTIDGIDHKTLNGRLEFVHENVSYGFSTKIYNNRVEVEIPPLQSIIKKTILESDDIHCKLDITGEGFHIVAWEDDMQVSRSLFVESDDPLIKDLDTKTQLIESKAEKKNDEFKNVLKEDAAFLKELKHDMTSDEKIKKKLTESYNTSKKEKKKKRTFNKKKFLKEAAVVEENAVEKGIPFSETSKNDNSEQKNLRLKIRSIIQESYIKKLNNKKSIKKKDKKKIITETKDINNNDSKEIIIDETNITESTIRSLMESVGMTTTKTQDRMIRHAKDNGAKTDIEIYDVIKGMVTPPKENNSQNTGIQENYQQQMKFFAEQQEK